MPALSNLVRVQKITTNYRVLPQDVSYVRGLSQAVPYAVPPPIGTIAAGELLVNATDRTMWLGVQPEIDPVQALLLSDIAGMLQMITDNLAAAKAYTDEQVSTRAPLVHTHTHTDITDFTPAVLEIIGGSGGAFKRGMVMMFHGDPTWIGNNTGPVDLTGWQLCDGTNNTPNLKDRFIIGHGTKVSGTFNTIDPNALKKTVAAGKHGHGNYTQDTTLTANMLPPHTHAYQDDLVYDGIKGHRHVIDDFGSWVTVYTNPTGQGSAFSLLRNTGSAKYTRSSPVYISILANTTRNDPHRHYIYDQADHQHDFPADAYEAMPWFSLAYIMKL